MTYATKPAGPGGNGRGPSPFIPPAQPVSRSLLSVPRITVPAPPAEGWLSLGLLIVMGLTFGWSIDNARWVLGRDGLTDFLPWVVTLSIVWSFLAAWAGWGRWFSHGMGAVFAALIVPLFVGATLIENGSLHDMYAATANSVVQAYLDLAWRGKTLTQQYGHFALILGLIAWATGQFASYAAFGHKRPMTAVVTLGLALLINMSITIQDQLSYLVIFSLAALLFLIRVNALHEQGDWIRRRIGDPKAVTGLYLRGGVTFVAIAVIGSLFLTASASSAPLADAWTGLDQSLINFGTQLQRYLPGGGPGTRITGVAFGSNAPITGRWVTDSTPALKIAVPAADDHIYYWRAVAYDHFDNTGWSWTRQSTVDTAAAGDVLNQTPEDDDQAPVLREVPFHVTPLAYRGSTIFSPVSPEKVDQNTKLTLVAGSYFGGLDLSGGSGGYTVTALVPQTADDDPDGITENKLRAASTTYPAEITNLYLDVPPGSVGPDMRALLATVESLTPGDDPYDLAQAAVSYMRSPNAFTYSTDVTDLNCGDRSIAECFAHFKRGYCQYYATTMTMLMRMAGIPARYVQGFLPGQRDANGVETILYSSSHAWVEVYFPGYGWVTFDPTGGGVGRLTSLPTGPPVPSEKPTAAPSRIVGDDERDPLQALPPGGDIVPQSSGGIVTPGGPLVIVFLLLFIVIGSGVLVAWRRSRARQMQPEAVYSGVTRLAGRLGFRPRPTETVFEYTGALAGVLPKVRPDLQTVANAKVEVAYGRADLPPARLAALREAQRRLQLGLLRLLFRRRGR